MLTIVQVELPESGGGGANPSKDAAIARSLGPYHKLKKIDMLDSCGVPRS